MYEKKILLVDDDPHNLDLLKEILAFAGFKNLVTAKNSEEAFQELNISLNSLQLKDNDHEQEVDLVLLDIMMPGISGFEACITIKQCLPSLPVVLVTALDDDINNVRGIECGADDYLTKPLHQKVLIAKVKALLKQKSQDDDMMADYKNYQQLYKTLPPYSLKNGDKVDNLQIVRLLGQGASANVYLAQEIGATNCYALKILRVEDDSSVEKISMFRREVETLMCLKHPNIIGIKSFGFHKGVPYFLMNYIDGFSLKQFLHSKDKLDLKLVLHIAKSIASALQLVHENFFLHRDLKAENIIMTFSGDVVLTDFGISRTVDFDSGTDKQGTVPYMSPEALMGSELSVQTDIYSYGVLLFYLITGQLPFHGDKKSVIKQHHEVRPPSVKSFRRDCPQALVDLTEQCLAKKTSDRIQSMQKIRQMLSDVALAPSVSRSIV